MPAVGIGILWFGYSILYYGITQVNGGNWGYLDLVVPSRWTQAKAETLRDGANTGTTPNQYSGGTAAVQATGVPSSASGSPAFVQPPSPIK